jgi:hypothetical protein
MNIYTTSLPLGLKCDKCGSIGLWQIIDFSKYFTDQVIYCPSCGKEIDLFRIYECAIKENFMFFDAFHCIGATSTTFSFTLEENKLCTIEYSDYGIPKESKILNVNYTPEGGLFPNESHGNNPTFEINRNEKIPIFPMRLMPGEPCNKVNAMITWIKSGDSIFDNLVNAFHYYSSGKYIQSILPANVVVEFSINKLINKVLSKYVSKKRVEEFLISDATYSHQLNIILPYMAVMQGEPIKVLNENIRGKLNALRNARNDLAHRGESEVSISKEDVAGFLTAALFGYIYLGLLEKAIDHNCT